MDRGQGRVTLLDGHAGPSTQDRLDRMGRVIAEIRRQGALADPSVATLIVADLAAYAERHCEAPLRHLIRRAGLKAAGRICAPTIPPPSGCPSGPDSLAVALARDDDARDERLEVIAQAHEEETGGDPDTVVVEAMVDLWLWCAERELPAPDALQVVAEVLDAVARGALH